MGVSGQTPPDTSTPHVRQDYVQMEDSQGFCARPRSVIGNHHHGTSLRHYLAEPLVDARKNGGRITCSCGDFLGPDGRAAQVELFWKSVQVPVMQHAVQCLGTSDNQIVFCGPGDYFVHIDFDIEQPSGVYIGISRSAVWVFRDDLFDAGLQRRRMG